MYPNPLLLAIERGIFTSIRKKRDRAALPSNGRSLPCSIWTSASPRTIKGSSKNITSSLPLSTEAFLLALASPALLPTEHLVFWEAYGLLISKRRHSCQEIWSECRPAPQIRSGRWPVLRSFVERSSVPVISYQNVRSIRGRKTKLDALKTTQRQRARAMHDQKGSSCQTSAVSTGDTGR